jgi:Tfp pilus assembly major pilin PilA
MRSRFIAVLIIILIGVVGIASYLWYQSNLVREKQTVELVKKETVVKNAAGDIAGSWKTFTSQDKSVTFQYPKDLPASKMAANNYSCRG